MTPLRAYLLAWSAIADDPRVRRMGDALRAAGWEVTGLGLPGARMAPPKWQVLETPTLQSEESGRSHGLLAALERIGARGASAGLAPLETALRNARSPFATPVGSVRQRLTSLDRPLSRAATAFARRARTITDELGLSPEERAFARYWRLSPHLRALRALALSVGGPALWIANDWWALPAAAAGAARAGGVLVYDSHELATEEYAELPEWQRFQRPIVAAVEARHIRGAACVTTVSPGISDHLTEIYSLTPRAVTLRNTPPYQAIPFRPVGSEVRVLYHGVVAPGRGLEEAIKSVPLWRNTFSLHIRGPASGDYAMTLRQAAAAAGVTGRVHFLPPAPMTELVAAAAPFDIGLMALPAHSLHNRYALPNKVFEYLMAGLALAVTDLPEMARIVRETNAGVLFGALDAQAMADVVNALTPEMINGMRRNALEAAKTFNWEAEQVPVMEIYKNLMRPKAQRRIA